MIKVRLPGKDTFGTITCAKCGAEAKHPTLESDKWWACSCADPDRCLECGLCPKCYPPIIGGG
jgi:hypothetical protein